MQIFKLAYFAFLYEFLGEQLMANPHDIVLDLVRMTATMGANTFTDFTESFVIDVLFEIAQRIYLDPGIDALREKWLFLMRVCAT